MDKPILSVVIPCWNAEEHLSTMLTSVKNQSFREWVTYIIDDGSNDNSREIANSFCLLDRRFNLIIRERKLKCAQTCRNIGLDLFRDNVIVGANAVVTHSFEPNVVIAGCPAKVIKVLGD